MKRDHAHLLIYLAAILLATLIHHPAVLAFGLLLVLLAAGPDALRLLRRALLTVLVFNTVISLSYAIMAWMRDLSPWETLLRLNLRVVLLTTLTFLFIARVNLFRALDFSRNLTYLLGLAYSQAMTFHRAHEEFRLALASRSLGRPRLVDRYRASAATVSWFLEKSIHTATHTAQALRSRGFFHD